jgi:hypothetical protein
MKDAYRDTDVSEVSQGLSLVLESQQRTSASAYSSTRTYFQTSWFRGCAL